VFSFCAQAQNSAAVLSNFSLGLEAYKEGKFRRAFDAWNLGAYEGNTEAQFNLGVLYLEGTGVERNAEQARTWFMKAAEKNHVLAQYNLGHMALSGMGSEKNIQEAIKWWKLAAEGGHFQAQFNYGRALYLGIDGHEDKAGGLVFLRQAAVQKDKRAIKFLNENAEEIAKVIPAIPEAGSNKPVVADNNSLTAVKTE
jgi:TPR repeat protein